MQECGRKVAYRFPTFACFEKNTLIHSSNYKLTMTHTFSLEKLPPNFTSISSSYKMKALLAVAGIILFITCYFAMLAAFAWLLYYSITYEIETVNRYTIILKLASIAGSGMMLFFGVKFMFKKGQKFDGNDIEITPQTEPELYEFIQQLIKETGAPKPKKIGINNDVNAFVYYNSTFLSLFFPAKKNLMIGMGLMNALNLSEFKAVLAHEFGHFSQSSMRVGSYIYMSNRVIHDMVFNRDKWDELLNNWRAVDIRLSFMAWAITPLVWLVRQLMMLFYKLLNILNASLSREMEFHADKVAVSVTGSDAIVDALWKLEYASMALNETYEAVYHSVKQGVYAENIYRHQLENLAGYKNQMEEGISKQSTNEHGVRTVFDKEVYSSLSMYDSHPPSSERERNAKTPFIKAETDTRTPTELFQKALDVQQRLTHDLYVNAYQVDSSEWKLKASSKAISTFIEEERKDKELFPQELRNTFSLRFVSEIQHEEVIEENNFLALEKDQRTHLYAELINRKLPALMEPVLEFDQKIQHAQEIADGRVKARVFSFGGVNYKRKNIQHAINYIATTKQKYLNESFQDWDKEFIHLAYAKSVEGNRDNEFVQNLKFLTGIQDCLKAVVAGQGVLIDLINRITSMNQVTEEDLKGFRREVSGRVTTSLADALNGLKELEVIPLPNIPTKDDFLNATINDVQLVTLTAECFNDGSLNIFLSQIDTLVFNLNRVQMKALGQLIHVSGLSLN